MIRGRERGEGREGTSESETHKHNHVGYLLGTLMACLLFLLS